MVALYTLSYNLIRAHAALRVTHAMAAGLAETFLGLEGALARIDEKQKPKELGLYRKRNISK